MRLPRNWEIELEEYKKTALRNNEAIYDGVTNNQFHAIRAYFRWRSRIRFRELIKDTSLQAMPKKAEHMSSIMGNILDWEYDGCIDTGYFGGGECSLGHALRYEHYAHSPSTGEDLVFGSKCVSDFFGIAPEKLRAIGKVQDDVLNEIKLVTFIMDTGKFREYMTRYYGDLIEVVNALKPNVDECFGHDWNEQMANFLGVGIPFTPSMIDRLQWVKKTYYSNALELKRIKDLFQDQVIIDAIDGIGNKPITFMGKMVLRTLQDDAVAADRYGLDTDNKRKLMVVLGYKVEITARELLKEEKNPFMLLTNADANCIGEDDYSKLDVFNFAVNGDSRRYNDDQTVEKILSKSKEIVLASDWIIAGGLDSAGLKKVELEEMVSTILMECPEDSSNWTLKTALDICKKHRKFGYRITENQRVQVEKAYAIIVSSEKNTEKPKQVADESVKRFEDNSYKIEYIMAHRDSNIKGVDFAVTIIGTVTNTGRMSEKQLQYIDNAYNEIKKMEKSDGTKKTPERAKEKEEEKVEDYSEDEEEDNRKVVREPEIGKDKMGGSKDGIMLTRIPSVSEMSGILGQGLLEDKEK